MNRKIAACFLAGILSITAVPVPAAAQEAVSGKNVSEEPLDAIRAQEIAMEKQEELEEEENMPAEEPDPLVLDEDGKVVPASAASWTEETQEPENAETVDAALPDDFSDGNPDGNTEETNWKQKRNLWRQKRKAPVHCLRMMKVQNWFRSRTPWRIPRMKFSWKMGQKM